MTNRPPTRNDDRWLKYVALAIFCIGVIWQSATVASRVDRNAERITRLEVSDAAQTDKLDTINQRGSRIEAKIDLLIPGRKEQDER